MPWCGRVDRSSVRKQLMRAIEKGGYAQNGNREVRIYGDIRETWTFAGPRWRLDGKIECRYYGTRILTLDLVNKEITDHGMNAYNSCTRNTISGWEDVLFDEFGLRPLKYNYWQWTRLPTPGTDYARFVARAPWVRAGWFRWELFDSTLANAFNEGQSFLSNDQNWRWFNYDWDQDGNWSRRFINANAERRYRQREKRWQRISTTTKNTSNRSSTKEARARISVLPWPSTTPPASLPGTVATPSPIG
jgi:hypothetical protein